MDLDTIYSKTGKGTRALSAKAKDLPKGALKVLPFIDSKSTARDILHKLAKFTEVEFQILLTQLESGGYIRAIQGSHWEEDTSTSGTSAIVVEELSSEDFLRDSPEQPHLGLPDLQPTAESAQDDARLKEAQRIYQEFAERMATETQKQSEQAKAEELRKQAREEARKAAKEKQRQAEEQARLAAEAEAAREADVARAEEARRLFETEQAARLEAERIAREQAEREASLAEEARRRIEAETKLAAEQLALLEAKRQAQEEKAARKQAEAERKALEAAEKKAKKEEEERRKAEAKEQARLEKASREAEELRAREEQERRLHEEQEARRKAEEERMAREEAERQARREEEARLIAEAAARDEAKKQARLAEESRAREEAERQAALQREAEQNAEQARRVQQEAERQAREAEVAQRKAAAAEARRQAKEEAQRETEERARRKQEQKQRELAERLAKKIAKREAARASREPGQIARIVRTVLVAIPVTLVLLIAALHFINLAPFATPIARAASESLGEPVRFATLHASLLPQPELRLGDVRVGDHQPVQFASARAEFALSRLFKDIRHIERLTVEEATMSMDHVNRMQHWFANANTSRHITIANVTGKNIALYIPGLKLPALNGELELSGNGSIQNAQLETEDRTLSVALSPQGSAWKFTLDAHAWQPPLRTSLKFDELHAGGNSNGKTARFDLVEGRIYGGKFRAKGTLDWTARPSASGSFEVENIDLLSALTAAGSTANIAGKLQAAASFSSIAADAESLMEAASLNGKFTLSDGTLGGIDLASAMLPANRDKNTRFDKLSGTLQSDNGAYRYRNLTLASQQFRAQGSLDIQEDRRISGTVSAELTTPSRRMQASFGIGGTVGDARIR